MEDTYGLGVVNRFALFMDNESDPIETLIIKEQEKEQLKKKAQAAEKKIKVETKSAPKSKPPSDGVPKKTSDRITKGKREDSKPNNRRPAAGTNGKPEPDRNISKNDESREEGINRKNREDNRFNGPSENRIRENRPPRERNGENRGRGERGGNRSFDGKPAGQRGPRRPYEERDRRVKQHNLGSDKTQGHEGVKDRPLGDKPACPRGPRRPYEERNRWGKREFDRKNEGGKPVDKRDGSGSPKDVIEKADQNSGEVDKPETDVVPEQKKDNAAEVEEEPKELSLDEYKAVLAARAKPQYNIRKAGEGEDLSRWEQMYELQKKKNASQSQEEEYDAVEYPQRVGRQKRVSDIAVKFSNTRRVSSGTFGRGGKPNARGENYASKVDYERDFPSLNRKQ